MSGNGWCKSIIRAASDARILGLGEDLIAKEAKYRNTCRCDYVGQDEDEKKTSSWKKHSEVIVLVLAMGISFDNI